MSVTPSAFNWPDCTNCGTTGPGANIEVDAAAEQIGHRRPGAFVGHVQQLDPGVAGKQQPDRCEAAPTPDEPKVSPSGFSLAYLISSAVVFTGKVGLATSR